MLLIGGYFDNPILFFEIEDGSHTNDQFKPGSHKIRRVVVEKPGELIEEVDPKPGTGEPIIKEYEFWYTEIVKIDVDIFTYWKAHDFVNKSDLPDSYKRDLNDKIHYSRQSASFLVNTLWGGTSFEFTIGKRRKVVQAYDPETGKSIGPVSDTTESMWAQVRTTLSDRAEDFNHVVDEAAKHDVPLQLGVTPIKPGETQIVDPFSGIKIEEEAWYIQGQTAIDALEYKPGEDELMIEPSVQPALITETYSMATYIALTGWYNLPKGKEVQVDSSSARIVLRTLLDSNGARNASDLGRIIDKLPPTAKVTVTKLSESDLSVGTRRRVEAISSDGTVRKLYHVRTGRIKIYVSVPQYLNFTRD